MGLKIGLVLVGLFNILNGLLMLADPNAWFARVIGDVAMGPMDDHFIRDVGFAYLASGAGLVWGIRAGRAAAAFALAGAVWPMLHAFFHLNLWIMHGVPHGAALLNEGVGVVVLSFAGALFAWLRFMQGGTR
ncbi:MAG TPA: hypothetical protein VGI20_01415 [Rhizomicrobium sp.]|jgi:uncharacterized protein YjeT (DUF2065 family)